MATEGLRASVTPFVNQTATCHIPPGTLSFGGPYTNSDKGIPEMGQSLIKGALMSRDGVPKMSKAQELSRTPSTVQKTAQKVSAWSVLWRVVVSLPLGGALGWYYLYQASNNPENKMIKSLETPTDVTYTVGSKKEPCKTSGGGAPLIASQIEATPKTVELTKGKSIEVVKEINERLRGGFQELKVFDIFGQELEEIPGIKDLKEQKDRLSMEPIIQKHPFISSKSREMLLQAYREKGEDPVYQFDGQVDDDFSARLPKGQESSIKDYLKAYGDGPNKGEFAQEVTKLFAIEGNSRARHYLILDLLKIEPAFDILKDQLVSEVSEIRADALGSWMGVDGHTAFSNLSPSNPMAVLQVFLKEQFRSPFSAKECKDFASLIRGGGNMDMKVWPPTDGLDLTQNSLDSRPEIRLQPKQKEGSDTIYPVQVTWQKRLNFKDGTYNDYVINQTVEIRQKGDGSPCEIRERRSVNPNQE